jgi:hypothetical protein
LRISEVVRLKVASIDSRCTAPGSLDTSLI